MPHTVTLNITATYDDATYEMAVSQLIGKGKVGPLSTADVVDMIESTVEDSDLAVEVIAA